MTPSVASRRAVFSGFELDLETGELFRAGQRVPLQDQPFQILRLLLEHPGKLVTREELHRKLWPADTFVDFDHGLNKAVAKLRDALAGEEELIETLPKRGYRFIGRLESSSPINHAGPSATIRRRRSLLIGGAIVAVVIVAAVVARRALVPTPIDAIHSIAVLPLQNFSADPGQEYFSDGMTDALITDLAQTTSLKVISRTSTIQYKGTTKPLPQIARELGVDAIIEGSVVRDNDHVRITAQLIDARNDRHLWARSYERKLSGILALQDEIASDITGEIRASLPPEKDTQLPRPVDPAAYNEYLLGRYFWNKFSQGSTDSAIAHFNAALKIDPKYASAYAGLADAYLLAASTVGDGSYVEARAAARRALELDSSLAAPHATLARLYWADWDFRSTENEFQLAISRDRNYATAHQWHSQFLLQRGRFGEAQEEAQLALELDPLSLAMNSTVAEALAASRQFDKAIAQFKKTLGMDPAFFPANFALVKLYRATGRHDLAVAQMRALCDHVRKFCTFTQKIEKAYATGGHKAVARLLIKENLRDEARGQRIVAWKMATYYVDLGEPDQAFAWLEKSYQKREPEILDIKIEPLLDPLRNDPRFPVLVKKVGLPD